MVRRENGNSQWFEDLQDRLGHEAWIGDAAQIRASYVRKQKTDRRDAAHPEVTDRGSVPDKRETGQSGGYCEVVRQLHLSNRRQQYQEPLIFTPLTALRCTHVRDH